MKEASPELIDFIQREEASPGEGVYISHIAYNYKGSDRPVKGKFSKWLHDIEHIEVFLWGSEQCCRVADSIPSNFGSSSSKPSTMLKRKNVSWWTFSKEEANEIYSKATFLYEQASLLDTSDAPVMNDETKGEVLKSLDQMREQIINAKPYISGARPSRSPWTG